MTPTAAIGRLAGGSWWLSRGWFVWALFIAWAHVTFALVGCGPPASIGTNAAGGGQAGAGASGNGGAAGGEKKLERVRLALNWLPESEHGGFYAARIHGFYEAAGLDVEIIPGGPSAPVVPQVLRGDVEFGVANADNVLFGRAQESPIVAVMAALQHSPRCILVHTETGITRLDELPRLKELPEAKLALSPGAAFAKFLSNQVPLDGIAVVPYPGNVSKFLAEPNFAQQGYNFSEPVVARQQGANVTTLMLSDIGFDPYTSLLVTSEKLIDTRAELARKMVAASVRGWRKYVEEPEQTDQELARLNPEMNLATLAAGMEHLRPLVLGEVGLEGLGSMEQARWKALAEQMQDSGQLDAGQKAAEGAFRRDFLPEAKQDAAP